LTLRFDPRTAIPFCEKSVSEETRRAYRRVVKEFFHFVGGAHPSLVTPEHVLRWRESLKAKKRKSATISFKLSVVRSFFEYLRAGGHVSLNPAATKVVSPPAVSDEMKGRALTAKEVRYLLSGPNQETAEGARDYALLLVMLKLGVRVSEACSLRASSAHWSHGRWVVKFKVKGGRERTLPLPQEVRKAIDEYLKLDADIWDYDVPAQPVLVNVRQRGRAIQAVVVATKVGHVFLLDRGTGKSLFPTGERRVPQDAVAGEELSPTQPFPILPPPLIPQTLTSEDAWGITEADRQRCRERIKSLRSEGIFTPPSLQGSILLSRNHRRHELGQHLRRSEALHSRRERQPISVYHHAHPASALRGGEGGAPERRHCAADVDALRATSRNFANPGWSSVQSSVVGHARGH
jgi:site-specific recombinase XerD